MYTKPLKIAFILPSLANKGPVLVCRDIVSSIIKHTDECIVYYFDEVREVEFGCKCQKISFFSRIDLNSYDIVHSHMFRPDVFVWLRSLIGNNSFKSISTIHTAIYDDLDFAYSKLRAKLLPPLWQSAWNSFDQIIVLTNFAKQYYKRLKSSLDVIYNGRSISKIPIDHGDIEILQEIKIKYKILGTIASFDDRKGLDQVVRSLSYLKEFAFIIIGDGPIEVKNKLILLAEELNVSERLIFFGKRSLGDRYIPEFDFFVIPSISEGFPLALLEATAHGVSVICSNIPVFMEVFGPLEVSFFKLFDIKSLEQAVEYAMANDDMLKKNAYNKYLNLYTPQKMGDNYFNVYNKLINQ